MLSSHTSGFFTGHVLLRAALSLVGLIAISAAALAQTPAVSANFSGTCAPKGGHGLVNATVSPASGWSSVRTYFRKDGTPDWYYLEMRSVGSGAYWSLLPIPESETDSVQYVVAVRDAEGKETRGATQKVAVTSGCKPALTAEQQKYAQNLVVGETTTGQKGKLLVGFVCNDVVSRIDIKGEMRSDEACRKALILAAAPATSALVPLAVVGGAAVGVAIIRKGETNEATTPRP